MQRLLSLAAAPPSVDQPGPHIVGDDDSDLVQRAAVSPPQQHNLCAQQAGMCAIQSPGPAPDGKALSSSQYQNTPREDGGTVRHQPGASVGHAPSRATTPGVCVWAFVYGYETSLSCELALANTSSCISSCNGLLSSPSAVSS
jgi:hypothetical protein